MWSYSLLNTVITEACRALQKGQAVGSLLHLIHSSLRFLLAPFVTQITKMVCSNYSLETIAAIDMVNPKDVDRQHAELVHVIVQTIEPPPLLDILKLNVEATVSLSRQFSMPPRIAMYDIVSDQLLKLLDIAVRKLSTGTITQATLLDKFLELVEKDRIYAAVRFIDQHPSLLRLYKEDFVTRTLQMPAMKNKWLDVAIELLDGLCVARGKTDIVCLYLVKHFDEAKMTYLNICLRPLLELQNPPALAQLLPERNKIGAIMNTPKDSDTFILQTTVMVLWERLEDIVRDKSDDGEDQLANWAQVFRSLRARLKYRRTISPLLAYDKLLCFDMQMSLFLFMLNFALPTADTLAIIRSPAVNDLWKKLVFRKATDYKGLEGILPLVVALSAAAAAVPTEQQAQFGEDVISWFLLDNGPATQNPTQLKIIQHDTTTFVSFYHCDPRLL